MRSEPLVSTASRSETATPEHLPKSSLGRTHAILPAFNEAESLPPLLARFARLTDDSTRGLVVWVIDDGSTDGTADIASSDSSGMDVRVISHPENLGLGRALRSGLQAVLREASPEDVVVVMDADDTHDTALIGEMRKKIENGADLVVASRFVAEGCDDTAPRFRRFLSRCAALSLRRLLALPRPSDLTSGYRAYRVSLLQRASDRFGDHLIEESGFTCMVELLLKLRPEEPVIAEVPLVLRYDRKRGASKMRMARTVFSYLKLVRRELKR